ncbi:phage/plasmid primase, P4 family [Nodosilinea sp. PGN35]|uniref:phage/plasmid primase, P4 family n=1 Tax=Nodosilinea sp. PGN35 TaxID=3020489 RepID=UPI00398A52B1
MAHFEGPHHLTAQHLADLENSGLNETQARAAGHFSSSRALSQELVGFHLDGLMFRYCDPDGTPYTLADGSPFYRIKPDRGQYGSGDLPKYLSSKEAGCRPYFSNLYPSWREVISKPSIAIWETEGEKKGDCGCAFGLPVIGFGGVHGWVDKRDRVSGQELEDSRPLPELIVIDWKNRRVNQCFDSDVVEKQPVQQALAKRAKYLQESGAKPYFIRLPNEIDGSKNGLDDFVARHGIDALKRIAEVSEPTCFKEDRKGNIKLDTKEPDILTKAIMSWAVLKEHWAFRPGIGWYEYSKKHWRLRKFEEFEQILTKFMDTQHWRNRAASTINAVTKELRSRLLIREELWNSNDKLAFLNGTLDAKSNQFVYSHNTRDYLTKIKPYQFVDVQRPVDWEAMCPVWLSFLREATGQDRQIVDLLQAWIKYLVTPRIKEEKALIEKSLDLFGPKGSGKGTFLDVVIALVGEENVGSAAPSIFKTPVGLGQLIDKDLALDTDSSGFLENVGAFNKVVSNEPVEVKKLYRDSHVMRLGVVVVRAYNQFIDIPGGSEGLDRRLTIVSFKNRPKKIDPNLARKLKTELSGIFAWAWQLSDEEMQCRILRAGNIAAVAEASIERFEANNQELPFLREVFPNGAPWIQAKNIYRSYRDWCDRNGYKAKSQRKFGTEIQSLGCQRHPKTMGCYFYTLPNMECFDVAAHLGITVDYEGELGPSRDYERDDSKPYPEQDRDSCRPLAPQTNFDQTDLSEIKQLQIGDDCFTKIVPTIPTLCQDVDPTLSNPETDCPPTVPSDPISAKMPPLEEGWLPVVGELVKVYQDGSWYLARILSLPNDHPDPKQRLSCWKVELEYGEESRVWKLESMRPIAL